MTRRVSRKDIDSAYRKVYGVTKKSLTTKDDKVINAALSEVRQYEGTFPGEGDYKSIVDKREQDEKAISGDPSTLVRYFREIGLAESTESDWEVIFRLHRDYINPSTKKTPEELESERMSTKEDVSEQQNEEPGIPEVVAEPTVSEDSSYIKTQNKEETQMADNNMTIGDAMNTGNVNAAAAHAADMAKSFGATGGGSMNLSGTNLGETSLSDEEAKLAAEHAATTTERRKAWTQANKIKYFVIANMPLKDRIAPGETTGTIRNPKNQLENIVNAVWKDQIEGRPADLTTGCTMSANGELDIPVPNCVIAAGAAEDYKNVIRTLYEACHGGSAEIPVKLDGKLSGFRGVVVQTPDGSDSWLMPELKNQIVENGMAKMDVEGLIGSVNVQLKVASANQISNMMKRKKGEATKSDMVQLQIPGRDKMLDLKEAKVLDNEHIRFYFYPSDDASKVAVDASYNAYSVVSFKYQKMVKDNRPGAAENATVPRNMTKRIILDVKMKDSVQSTDPEMAIFEPKKIGTAAAPLKDDEAFNVVKALYESSMKLAMTGDAELDQKRAGLKQKTADTNAQMAADAMAGDVL